MKKLFILTLILILSLPFSVMATVKKDVAKNPAVVFYSSYVKGKVVAALGMKKGSTPTKTDMQKLKKLNLSCSEKDVDSKNEIINLKGLETAINLKELSVDNADLGSTLTYVKNLKIEFLSINRTLFVLADIPQTVKELHITGLSFGDFSWISRLKNLTDLDISEDTIYDDYSEFPLPITADMIEDFPVSIKNINITLSSIDDLQALYDHLTNLEYIEYNSSNANFEYVDAPPGVEVNDTCEEAFDDGNAVG
jgi:hypothetical protein